jgi:4-aminobutyrate aminotransferase-like enzyme
LFSQSAKSKILFLKDKFNMGMTKGQMVDQSTKIRASIDDAVKEAMIAVSQIEGIRPADPERETKAKELMEKIGTTRGRPLFFPYVGTGLGRGPYVELEDGSVKLDLINGIGIHLFGHCHPKLMATAARAAISDVIMQGNLQPNKEYYEFSKKLTEIAGRNSRLKHVWLSTCGTMANENALKACRQKKSPAKFIIAMNAAFAGRSTLMAEVTDNPTFKVGLPEYNEVLRIPWYDKNDSQSIDKTLRLFKEHVAKHENKISCFTFEPMQGEGGYNSAPREYFLPMLEFCREKQIPVWVDEVQTFSRTGNFFAYETLGIGDYVDVCTIAKTAQNGATLFTEELNPKPGLIAGTFSGSTVTLATGLEILNMLDKENYMGAGGKIQQIHKEFVGMLNRLNETKCKGLLKDAGGMGLMVAVTPFDGSKEKVDKLMHTLFKNGLICFNCGRGTYRLRFLIPAVMTTQDIQVAEDIIVKSVQELS